MVWRQLRTIKKYQCFPACSRLSFSIFSTNSFISQYYQSICKMDLNTASPLHLPFLFIHSRTNLPSPRKPSSFFSYGDGKESGQRGHTDDNWGRLLKIENILGSYLNDYKPVQDQGRIIYLKIRSLQKHRKDNTYFSLALILFFLKGFLHKIFEQPIQTYTYYYYWNSGSAFNDNRSFRSQKLYCIQYKEDEHKLF